MSNITKLGTRKISKTQGSRVVTIPPTWFENIGRIPTDVDIFIDENKDLIIRPNIPETKPNAEVE